MITKIFVIAIVFFFATASISPTVLSNESVIEKRSNFIDSLLLKDPCKVLFIGSSYFNFHDLPGLFEHLTISSGKEVYIDRIGENGMYLDDHASSASTEAKIKQMDWDYVILQGVGSLMAYPNYFTDHPEYPALETLWYKIHHHCESTKMVYCMPWAFEDGMTWYQNWTDTYADMQLKIYETTLNYSRDIGFMIAPVGWAWYAVLEEQGYPLHYLHMSDWNHPSLKGSYLMSCVLFSTLFKESSVGLSNDIGLSKDEATYFQIVASDIVLNNLSLWNIIEKQTIYVDNDNTAGPWNGLIEHPYQHIQDAIDKTSDGDTVFVFSGIYYENVVINKAGISLIGEDKDTTVIDAQKDGTPLRIVSDGCLISEFAILNCEDQISQNWEDAVIKIDGGNNVIILNNIINASDVQTNPYVCYGAIDLNGCTHCKIINNIIVQNKPEDYTIGIALHDNSSNNSIIGNDVSNYNFGFYVIADGNNRNNTILKNHFYHNRFGISAGDGYNEILNNTIEYNTEVGINIQNGYHYTISGNIIQYNGGGEKFHCGIELMGDLSNNNNYVSNNIILKNNPCGLHTEYSHGNVIIKNNFIDNNGKSGVPEIWWGNAYFHIQDGFFNKDCFKENYWSDSLRIFPKIINGYIEVTPGFILINWINIDWHPAQKPYDIPGLR